MLSNLKDNRPLLGLAASVGLLTASTVLSMVVFLCLVATGGRDGDDGGDGDGEGGGGWWWWGGGEGGGGPDEAENYVQLVFCPLWLSIVAASIAAATYRLMRAPTRLGMGVLGGCLLLFANMGLVCALYFWNLETPEEEGEDERRYRYLEEDGEDGGGGSNDQAEEEEGRAQLVLARFGVAFALLYLAAAVATLHLAGTVAPEADDDGGDADGSGSPADEAARSAAYVEILADGWRFLSTFSVAALLLTLALAVASLAVGDAERMREEGTVWNFLIVLAWVVALSVAFVVAGKRSLGGRGSPSRVEIGAFNGALYGFAGLSLLLAGLFASFGFEERRREESPLGTTFFSFLCLALAAAYASFAHIFTKHRHSVARANATDHLNPGSGGGGDKASGGSGGMTDFVRMDWDERSGHTAPLGGGDDKRVDGEGGGGWRPWSSIVPMEFERSDGTVPPEKEEEEGGGDATAAADGNGGGATGSKGGGWKRPWAKTAKT